MRGVGSLHTAPCTAGSPEIPAQTLSSYLLSLDFPPEPYLLKPLALGQRIVGCLLLALVRSFLPAAKLHIRTVCFITRRCIGSLHAAPCAAGSPETPARTPHPVVFHLNPISSSLFALYQRASLPFLYELPYIALPCAKIINPDLVLYGRCGALESPDCYSYTAGSPEIPGPTISHSPHP